MKKCITLLSWRSYFMFDRSDYVYSSNSSYINNNTIAVKTCNQMNGTLAIINNPTELYLIKQLGYPVQVNK